MSQPRQFVIRISLMLLIVVGLGSTYAHAASARLTCSRDAASLARIEAGGQVYELVCINGKGDSVSRIADRIRATFAVTRFRDKKIAQCDAGINPLSRDGVGVTTKTYCKNRFNNTTATLYLSR